MNEKAISPSLDVTLANVNPERRRFLGMLLAGAAALPLLASANLAAEDRVNPKANNKTGKSTTDKPGGKVQPTIKDNSPKGNGTTKDATKHK